MEVLFTGTGSIGSRHIRNLSAEAKKRGIDLSIDAIRYSERTLPEDIAPLIRREYREEYPEASYDILFVTEETASHFDSIRRYGSKARHMFIEKPIFSKPETGWQELFPKDDARVYYVACPIRFSNYYEAMQKVVRTHTVYSARIIFSAYMPNWQKGRDYRKSFRTDPTRGGGVDIDSLHEIDFMTGLFGQPQTVARCAGKYSDLEMEAADIADYIFTYPDKLVEMHLDYFGRTNNRRVEFFTKEDVVTVDFHEKTVTHQLTGEKESFAPDDEFYQREMAYFLDMVENPGTKENPNPPENAMKSLLLAKGRIK